MTDLPLGHVTQVFVHIIVIQLFFQGISSVCLSVALKKCVTFNIVLWDPDAKATDKM